MLNKHLAFILTSFCLLLPNLSHAAERWYQTEVVIAERLSIDLGSEIHDQPPLRKRNGVVLKSYPNFTSQALVERPADEMRLKGVADKLRNSGNYKVLYHKAWAQPFKANKRIAWIDIKGGEQTYDQHRLQGAIGISLGRFLHLFPRLTLNEFKQKKSNQQLAEVLGHLPFQQAQAWQQYQLTGTRKMRSKELHYLDHPKLVMLVRIDPFVEGATIPLPAPQE
jgi:hypothetical protein